MSFSEGAHPWQKTGPLSPERMGHILISKGIMSTPSTSTPKLSRQERRAAERAAAKPAPTVTSPDELSALQTKALRRLILKGGNDNAKMTSEANRVHGKYDNTQALSAAPSTRLTCKACNESCGNCQFARCNKCNAKYCKECYVSSFVENKGLVICPYCDFTIGKVQRPRELFLMTRDLLSKSKTCCRKLKEGSWESCAICGDTDDLVKSNFHGIPASYCTDCVTIQKSM